MSSGGRLKIERVIGNNVVLVLDETTGKEFVLLGKGIGFASKDASPLEADDPRIEKRFRLDDRDQMKDYQTLLEGIPAEVIRISENIIEMAAQRFERQINYKLYLALPSHIHFAVYRLKNGMDIVNPFLYETKMVFVREYEIACEAAAMIREAFQVDIPEDEIGFLSFHIHSGIADVSVGQIIKYTNLIHSLVATIEQRGCIGIPREGTDYVRLISHFRYMIERIVNRKTTDNPFMQEIKKTRDQEYALALELRKLMEEQLHSEVPEDEVGYMAMHLYRLFQALSSNT
ncbi:PRD domain-containing protein [Cohnella sp. JJ-181]|uniref:PRD domain-containing protein n=1 Tax=Cohnella rhizoplanae TaxID=2974897 RepID=UPI0022FF4FF0|nr:PRD domain-containing protein [Cohnella sp. JJ-181]CAI6087754.1 PtsGHI operon antiterminator [Cohnella sp. JJ-181]